MSARPNDKPAAAGKKASKGRITTPQIQARKGKDPIVCLTAYSTQIARILDQHTDLLLVGDSLGMVMHGLDSTVPVTMDMMILHGQAVMRGTDKACIIVDMPFGSYEESKEAAYRNAARIMQDVGCSGVKLEGGVHMADTIAFLVKRGIPVLAHIGLMPQSVNTRGGYAATGRTRDEWSGILADARAVERAGAFGVVIEGVAAPLADKLTRELTIPTIGIGASSNCDGQILVTDDMLGFGDRVPKFVKKFADLSQVIGDAVGTYASEVRERSFPGEEHTYSMKPGDKADLKAVQDADPEADEIPWLGLVEEDLRRDQMTALWKRYGGFVIGAAVAVVLATVGNVVYNDWQQSTKDEQASNYYAALDAIENDAASGQAALAQLGDTGAAGYSLLARFELAASYADAKDVENAAAVLDAIAADNAAPAIYRDLAKLKAVYLLMDSASTDDIDLRLQTLRDPGNDWYYLAEEAAALNALRREDHAAARQIIDGLLASDDASPLLQRRMIRAFVITSALALTLAACSWGGGEDVNEEDDVAPAAQPAQPAPQAAEPAGRERISVLAFDSRVEADPRLAGQKVSLPRPYENREWPAPGGYPSHAMHHLAAPGYLQQAWSVDIGAGSDSDARLLSSPIVVNNVVFTLDANGYLSSFDARNGNRFWTRRLGLDTESADELIGGGIAYDNGRLFATTGLGSVLAMAPATGKLLWRREFKVPFRSAPTAADDRVFVITHDNQMFALDAATGETQWDHPAIVETAGILGNSSPAILGDIVVAPFTSGELVALRVQNGRQIWQDTLTRTGRLTSLSTLNDIAGRPVIDRGRVFAISHSGRFVSIDLRTGERVWTRNLGSTQTPWVAGDYIYTVTGEGQVVCLNRSDGRVRWVKQLVRWKDPEDKDGPIIWNGPVLASDRLILASSEGVVLSLSPYSGKVLGMMETEVPFFIPPVVARGMVFLLNDELALVDDQPGVTRDRRMGEGSLGELSFDLIDTAGLEDSDDDTLEGRMRAQTDLAIEEADLCLFLIDARAGVTPLDSYFAGLLRKSDKPVLLLANKCEGKVGETGLYEAYELGLGDPIAISAEHGHGLGNLQDEILPFSDAYDAAAQREGESEDGEQPLRVAVVGRPNAGKSTLINRMIGEDRMLTGPEAGITRDSISVEWDWTSKDGDRARRLKLFDTAGMRKKARVTGKIEKLSVADGLRAVRFAEIVVVLIDALVPLEKQDLHIVDLIAKEGRGVVIAVNKWDLVEDRQEVLKELRLRVEELLPQIRGVPFITLSALTGNGIHRLPRPAAGCVCVI
ncbi:der [Symbiodinium microadriaticum]|nr:der [Symbiodinium microadriaticum]